ncbi:MFS general substrate transporter [Westerdykella ornata]|uniref:MFS general substrate transporter n=1 Tax=Westerdykella ornata TaxID=318751 RepID=A0A6A6JJ07_WESOR|nr:MFS general substrate transporter [Westerdykella ornata]KAF2276224.1 MFS general substrate transporter [Westerdykella ornata]
MASDSEKYEGRKSLSIDNSSTKHSISKDSQAVDTVNVPPGDSNHSNPDPAVKEDDLEGGNLARYLSRKSTRSHKGRLEPEKYPLMDGEKGLVGWESQDDPANPRNFPQKTKWFILGMISALTFLSPFASTICAPALPFINAALHNTSAIRGSFAVSIFVLGFAIGPLFLSPLSEIYGRRIILNIANLFFCAFSLGCALSPNLAGLLVMRLLAGMGGSACLTIGSGVISDLFVIEERGKAMAIYSMGVLWGPVIGPIIGGFVAQRAGWRWVFWVPFIASTVICTAIAVLNRETNPVVLMNWKTNKLRKETGRPELENVYLHGKPAHLRSPRSILTRGIFVPLKLLFMSPIVLLLSLYISFVFGLLYMLFTTVTPTFVRTYGFSPELSGLAYLGIGLGAMLGIVVVARTSDSTVVKLTKRNKGIYEPEMRLPLMVFFGMLIPAGLFWYGWSTEKHTHWISPILSLLPFGFGMMGLFAPMQTYLIDAFPTHAASAVAAMTTLRCLFGGLLPLAGPSMFGRLGLGWGNSLLGFIGVAMVPVPVAIWKYGGYVRKRWPVDL